jgi:hypothetical protein
MDALLDSSIPSRPVATRRGIRPMLRPHGAAGVCMATLARRHQPHRRASRCEHGRRRSWPSPDGATTRLHKESHRY